MQSYIETLGRMISAQVAPHPRRARRMLTAAYSWVRFSGKCQRLTDAKSAYARMNGAVARSLVRGLRHPERAVCVNIFMPCEMQHAMGLTPMYPAPLTLIDVPGRADDDAVAYVADQLRGMTRRLEALTGRKLDEAKLRASMACADRTLKLMREYAALRAEVTQDTTMTGELCSLIATHCLLGHADGENYVRELIETARRAPRRETTRRKRIFFIHTLPNWQDSMIRMLETENRCELVGCDLTFDSLTALDPEKPFESMARRLLANVNGGSAARRIDNAIAWAKKLNADGVILFCHWGCKQTMGLSTLAKRRLEEAGLPTLVLDGDGCDSRNVADGQMVTRVGAFLEQLEGMDA